MFLISIFVENIDKDLSAKCEHLFKESEALQLI